MIFNELYLTVLPMIHLAANQYGLTEQVITLTPMREIATEFFADEVQDYISIFERRVQYLVGGHVLGYKLHTISTESGRFVVKVVQHVA